MRRTGSSPVVNANDRQSRTAPGTVSKTDGTFIRAGIVTSVCRHYACIAQKEEHLLGKQKVDGSTPSVSSKHAACPGGEGDALKAYRSSDLQVRILCAAPKLSFGETVSHPALNRKSKVRHLEAQPEMLV